MKICLSARMVEQSTPRMPLPDFLRLAGECGYDGVGLRAWQIPDQPAQDKLEYLAVQVADSDLEVCSITTDREHLPTAAALAHSLGTRVLQVGEDAGTLATLQAWLATHLDQLDANMRIGPQMHTGGVYEQIGSAARELATVADARIGVIVEPANLMLAGVRSWEKEIWQPIAGRIVGCNIQSVEVGKGTSKSNLRDGSPVFYRRAPFDENRQANWPGFFASLRASGYDGFVNVIEPARENMPVADLARLCAAYLRQIIPAEGIQAA